MRNPISLYLSFVLLAAACAGASGAEPTTMPASPLLYASWSRIDKKAYDFKDAGQPQMEYAQFVPSTYDKTRKWPLVVLLHGLGSNPQQIMHYPGLTDQAEKRGYIIVAPFGYNNRGWYGAKSPLKPNPNDPVNLSELSEKDVMNVLEIAKKDFNIDPDRTYLMGHSMGGGGTWHIAIKNPNLFAALAPISPATLRPATDLEKIKHVPVILIQGAKDMLVRVEAVRPWAEEMKKLGMAHEYIEVPNGGHITVAWEYLPQIFDFFDKHKRGQSKKSET